MRRLPLLVLVPLVVLVAGAAPAQAATVSIAAPAKKVKFKAAAGEANRLELVQEGPLTVRFTDPQAVGAEGGATTISAGGTTCEKTAPDTVVCTLASTEWRVQSSLDDGDDTATTRTTTIAGEVAGGTGNDTLTGGDAADDLDGEAGNDTLTGGPGADDLSGGVGDDTFHARDATRDDVSCSDGLDGGAADLEDVLTADCENVAKPLAPPTVVDAAPPPAMPLQDAPTTAPQAPAGAPAPRPGATFAGGVEQGKVLVKRKNGRFVPLDPSVPVPVGAVVDARDGIMTLTAAADLSGHTQTARFTGGMFSVSQRRQRRKMTTVLTLRGELACGSNRSTARAAAGKRKRARTRTLWGDGHGRFTTRGRNSQASVRGTRWAVIDRCDGTLTLVRRGVVAVKDFRTGKTRLVRAGGRYLARKRAKNAR
jgi:Ca2+-binding RTX toxin-like protein